MSRSVHQFSPLSITASLHIKGTSALKLWRGLTQVTHIKLPLFFQTQQHTLVSYGLRQILFISSLPQHASLSLPLCYSFQTRSDLLEYIFGQLNSWCSVSQLLLALTQTATK
ncbi:unnamed protein product [Hymenolepis diminuta]|uniref:Uncharacterized protein n=1 Tax=Hymenolepis diminuta TaxID=6216 RepID=A0A564XZC6_HYMDI|nr:unnamed protein product [Hymenolepis diminuta]